MRAAAEPDRASARICWAARIVSSGQRSTTASIRGRCRGVAASSGTSAPADEDHRVAEEVEHPAEQLGRLDARGDRLVDQAEDAAPGRGLREGVEQVQRPLVAGDPELLVDQLDGQPVAAEREELFQERLGVPHRPAGPPGDGPEGVGVGLRPPRGAQISARVAAIWSGVIPAKSYRWQRERTVIGILFGSVVAKKNLTCSGGSSSVFSRALKAPVESMWTSSM